MKTVSAPALLDLAQALGLTPMQTALAALVTAIALSAAFATWAARRL